MHALKQYIKDQDTIFITRDGTKVKIIDIDVNHDEYPLTANIIGTDTKIWLTASGSYHFKDAVMEGDNEEHKYDIVGIVDYKEPQQPQPTTFTVGEYVTRDGRKAIVHYDISETLPDDTHPLFGYVEGQDGSRVWGIDGNVKRGRYTGNDADLIGPWVEPPYIITVNGKEFHPVKNPKNGEKYFYIATAAITVSQNSIWNTTNSMVIDTLLANLNLIYRTKEEAQAFLDEITKPNAEIKCGGK